MAHDANGRIFIDTSVTPPDGISAAEVKSVLAAMDGEELCGHSHINGNAKFKPMDIGGVSGYTAEQAKAANYGLLVPHYTNFSQMVTDIDNGVWTHATNYEASKVPWQNNGLSAASFHRIFDFNNYLHTAVPIMAALTMDKARYAATEEPEFITNAGGTSPYNLSPADISLIENGAVSMENMYLGICMHSLSGRFYKILGRCTSVGRGEISISDPGFNFPRANGQETITACMFLSDTNLNNGAVGTNVDMTGHFIPLTMSRTILQPFFDMPLLNLDFDSVSWHNPTVDGNTVFVIKSDPDSDYSWEISIFGEYVSAGAVHTVLDCEEFLLPMHRQFNPQTREPLTLYLRLETDRLNGKLKVDLYATDPSVGYTDIIAESSLIGSPIESREVEIVYGEILSDPTAVGLMTRAALVAKLHDYDSLSQSCYMGTWPTP